MPIIHRIPDEQVDTCVIGAGFAGLAVALALAETGQTVVVLEEGGRDPGPRDRPCDDIDLDPDSPHDPISEVCSRAFGGTSHKWGRRAVPLDPEDFEEAPGRGAWPITYADFEPWIPKAAAFLGCAGRFDIGPLPGWRDTPGIDTGRIERLAPPGSLARIHALAIDRAEGPRILLRAQATGLIWAEGRPARALGVRGTHRGAPFDLRARNVVLAAGGLETTRLLLVERQRNPCAIAGADLGRSYMGHVTGSIAEIRFQDPCDALEFAYRDTSEAGVARRRLRLIDHPDLNIVFWPTNISSADARHGSAELSMKHLAGLLRPQPPIHPGGTRDGIGRHLVNVAADPRSAIRSARSVVSRRLTGRLREAERLTLSPSGLYRLAFHSEQLQESDSLVELDGSRQDGTRPRLKVRFRIGTPTLQAIADAHLRLRDAVAQNGKADILLCHPDDALVDAVRDQARDGYHQIGLTRMSVDSSTGVVDPDARVHGTTNLWVASSSIFPSAGQANPTLSIVALALRLARHLSAQDNTQEPRALSQTRASRT